MDAPACGTPPDLLADGVTAEQLDAWADLMPASFHVVGANLFGDVFVRDAGGAIHMLEVSASSLTMIADTEEEFHRRCHDDIEGWLLRPLLGRCRAAGLIPGPTQSYAFTTLPLFGGSYDVENIWICSREEWLSFTALIYTQTKDLPDGATVVIDYCD